MSFTDRTLRRLMWLSAAAIVVGIVVSLVFSLSAGRDNGDWVFAIGLLIFPAVGFLVVSRRPRNTLGWLMVSMGFVAASPLAGYGAYAIEHDLPLGPLALALDSPSWVPFIGISGYLLLLFPDGHLPSPRWRWFAWLCGIGMGSVVVLIWVFARELRRLRVPGGANPIGIEALERVENILTPLLVSAPLLVLGGAVSLIVRLRRSTDDVVRHQIRWLAYSASLIAVLFIISFLPQAGNAAWTSWFQSLAVLSFALIPITIGLAVLRYRLYDIDIVIRKTVVFAIVAGFDRRSCTSASSPGVGAIVGASSNTAALGAGRSDRRPGVPAGASSGSALGRPVRVRASCDAVRGHGDVRRSARGHVRRRRRLGADRSRARARAWELSVPRSGCRGRRDVAWWRVAGRRAGRPTDHVAEVRHQGELLGELAVAIALPRTTRSTRRASNSWRASLPRRVWCCGTNDSPRSSASDCTSCRRPRSAWSRRRTGSGASSSATSTTARSSSWSRSRFGNGSLEQLVERDPSKAKEMLEQLQIETRRALDDLRDLARGIYPPLLADKGLIRRARGAIATAHRSPSSFDADGTSRYPQDVEAAVYFSSLEALQNIAKYAQASQASVQLSELDGTLEFRVTDDGVGLRSGVDRLRHRAPGDRRPPRCDRRRVADREFAGRWARP